MNDNNERERHETSRPVTAAGFPVQALAAEMKAGRKEGDSRRAGMEKEGFRRDNRLYQHQEVGYEQNLRVCNFDSM